MEASSGVAMEPRGEDAGTEAVERTETMQLGEVMQRRSPGCRAPPTSLPSPSTELVQSISSSAAAGDADALVRVALRASQLSMQGPALAALEALMEVFAHPLPAKTLSILILDLSSLVRTDSPAPSAPVADADVSDVRRAVRLVLAASHLHTDDGGSQIHPISPLCGDRRRKVAC